MSKKLNLVLLGIFAILFFLFIPRFIQGGDTAELVNASYHLFVPHPPGYPSFLWMEYIWTHLLPVSTVFWRAGSLCAVLAIFALGILSHPLKDKARYLWFPFLFLGLVPEFVEAAVLPDVFALHALFVSFIGYLFLFCPNKERRAFWLPLLFVFSFTNHHTMVFLFPCFLFTWWESKEDRKKFYLGTILGVILCAVFYLSLLICHPEHALSWGNITDLKSLVLHILRYDYGTLKLSASGKDEGFGPLLFLFESIWANLLVILVLIGFVVQKRIEVFQDRRLQVWIVALIFTFTFFLLMNITPNLIGKEILRRFHVMPLIMLTTLSVFLLNEIELVKKEFVILVVAFLPMTFHSKELVWFFDLRNDSVIEDYSRNLYFEAVESSPSLVAITTDTAFFGLRYIQAFQGNIQKDKVAVVSPPLLFHPWFQEKVKDTLPNFIFSRGAEIARTREYNINYDLILPNLEKINFVMTSGHYEGMPLSITYRKLGRVLQAGKGIHFEEKTSPHFKIDTIFNIDNIGPQAFTKGKLFYEYSHFYQSRAFENMLLEKTELAIRDWEEALRIVPFAYPAMQNICQHDSLREFCQESVKREFEEKVRGFYQ